MVDQHLSAIAQGKNEIPLDQACEQANKSLAVGDEEATQINAELGKWFSDYLSANGYQTHTNPSMIKHMIMTAFPTIMEDEKLTPENLEDVLLNARRVYAQHAALEKDSARYTFATILGTGTTRAITYV